MSGESSEQVARRCLKLIFAVFFYSPPTQTLIPGGFVFRNASPAALGIGSSIIDPELVHVRRDRAQRARLGRKRQSSK